MSKNEKWKPIIPAGIYTSFFDTGTDSCCRIWSGQCLSGIAGWYDSFGVHSGSSYFHGDFAVSASQGFHPGKQHGADHRLRR